MRVCVCVFACVAQSQRRRTHHALPGARTAPARQRGHVLGTMGLWVTRSSPHTQQQQQQQRQSRQQRPQRTLTAWLRSTWSTTSSASSPHDGWHMISSCTVCVCVCCVGVWRGGGGVQHTRPGRVAGCSKAPSCAHHHHQRQQRLLPPPCNHRHSHHSHSHSHHSHSHSHRHRHRSNCLHRHTSAAHVDVDAQRLCKGLVERMLCVHKHSLAASALRLGDRMQRERGLAAALWAKHLCGGARACGGGRAALARARHVWVGGWGAARPAG
jgi:hypothetical protein